MHMRSAAVVLLTVVAGSAMSSTTNSTPADGLAAVQTAAPRIADRLTRLTPGVRLDRVRMHRADDGSMTIAWTAVDGNGVRREGYIISDDGVSVRAGGEHPRVLALAEQNVDPLIAGPSEVGATGLHVVQLAAPTTPALLAEIESLGGEVLKSVPGFGYIVRGDQAVGHRLLAWEMTRWIGPFTPAMKVSPELKPLLAVADQEQTDRYSLMLVRKGEPTRTRVHRRIADLGGVIHATSPSGFRVEATLTAAQLAELAASAEVLAIDPWSEPEVDMDNARALTGADFVESTLGFTGQGVVGEIMDNGLRVTHADFQSNPPIINLPNSDSDDHGTPVYGIVFGDGASLSIARGMMPDGIGVFSSYFSLGDRYAHTEGLINNVGAVFQTNSWGFERTRLYNTFSAELDDILFQNDILITQSQSNAGNQDSRPQAWAKNVVSVGGVFHNDTQDQSDDRWSLGASTGPAIDGRIKPDLSHFFDLTATTGNGSDTQHVNFGGTSGATPLVAGHFGIFFQMWAEGVFGNPTSGGTVFTERPRATTAKAMIINTARAYAFGSPADDLSRYRQGWGFPDLQSLYERRNDFFIVDDSGPIGAFEIDAYDLDVQPGPTGFAATLVYRDPAGNPAAASHTVNDLTLRVTSPSGDVYFGNVGLRGGNESVPGGDPSRIDTVENVVLNAPEPGQWRVEVIAAEINEDGRPQTGALDADYSLVVSGVEAVESQAQIVLRDIPALVEPGVATDIEFGIRGTAQTVDPADVAIVIDLGIGPQTLPVVDLGGGRFGASIPALDCGGVARFAIEAELSTGETIASPANGPDDGYTINARSLTVLSTTSFDSPAGWTVVNESLTDGGWTRGVPVGGGLRNDPPRDFDGGACWLTDNQEGNSDVDGGPTWLISPTLDLSSVTDPHVSFALWVHCDDAGVFGEDQVRVEFSDNNGATWTPAETYRSAFVWETKRLRVSAYVAPTDQVRMRVGAIDNPNDSVLEVGFDAFSVLASDCGTEPEPCPADITGDGTLDFFDVQVFLDGFSNGNVDVADFTMDQTLDFFDVQEFLSAFSRGCP